MGRYIKIENVRSSYMTNAEYATFIAATLARLGAKSGEKLVADKLGVTADCVALRKRLDTLEDIVRRLMAAGETKELEQADRRRDQLAAYILQTIRNERNAIIEDRAEAARRLMPPADLYRGVTRLRDADETATIRGMAIDLRKPGMAESMAKLGLVAVLDELEKENKRYAAIGEQRRLTRNANNLGAAKPLRREMEELYEDIADRAFAVSVVTPEVTEAAAFIAAQNQAVTEVRHTLAQRKASPGTSPKGKGKQPNPHAEELAKLKTLIAEYEQSSHFTAGAVKFTGLAAGTGAERAYQVYLADEPKELYWLTVKDGKLTEADFKIEPGQPGGLTMERIK